MTWWTDWGKDATLAALALYGAGLSTLNLLQLRAKEKRRVKVEAEWAFPFVGANFMDDHVRVTVTNVGHRKVTITSLGLEAEGKRLVSLVGPSFQGLQNTELPATLDDGQRAVTYYVKRDLGLRLSRTSAGKHKLVPYCVDSTGAVHRGEAISVESESMLKNF